MGTISKEEIRGMWDDGASLIPGAKKESIDSKNILNMRKKKKPNQNTWPSTDPSKYGIADCTFSFAGLGDYAIQLSDSLADIDIPHALEAIRRLKTGGKDAIL